jgi:large subunit ribosomal protein L21
MFAIIKTGGKQYIVHPGDKIKVEKLNASKDSEVVFDNVLLVSDKETLIGTPFVVDYRVRAKIVSQGKGKKVIIYKYKPKKRYHKKQGHRQLYSEVEILSISQEGQGGEAKVAARTQAKRTVAAKKKVPAAAKGSAVKKKAPSKPEESD